MNQSALDGTKGEIVMYQPDETIRLEVSRQLSALLHVWGHGLIYM